MFYFVFQIHLTYFVDFNIISFILRVSLEIHLMYLSYILFYKNAIR